mmetsp:Transcript_15419/g.31642  ORF Transcript_15419/g.31642 Transcript_15419/m.31642 type:complete len:251 (+) Transcript_15419:625-1377(+)
MGPFLAVVFFVVVFFVLACAIAPPALRRRRRFPAWITVVVVLFVGERIDRVGLYRRIQRKFRGREIHHAHAGAIRDAVLVVTEPSLFVSSPIGSILSSLSCFFSVVLARRLEDRKEGPVHPVLAVDLDDGPLDDAIGGGSAGTARIGRLLCRGRITVHHPQLQFDTGLEGLHKLGLQQDLDAGDLRGKLDGAGSHHRFAVLVVPAGSSTFGDPSGRAVDPLRRGGRLEALDDRLEGAVVVVVVRGWRGAR